MFIGYLKINIFIPHSRTLKEKRRVMEKLKRKLLNNFNISIAEKPSDKWQESELFCVFGNYTKNKVKETIDSVENFINKFNGDFQLIGLEKGVL